MKTVIKSMLTALLIASTPCLAEQPVKLNLGHGAAPGNPRHEAAVFFANTIKQKTDGRYEIFVAHSSEFGNDATMVTLLRAGTLALSANSQGPIAAVVPEYAALGLPFLFSSIEKAWQLLDGPIGKDLADRTAAKGMIVLGFWDNGIRQMTNSKRTIRTPADVKGLKIRTPQDPVTMDIMHALGATAHEYRFSELYAVLQQGEVDGQENPLTNIASAKLYEVQKYLSLTSHKYEVTPFLMGKRYWERLSKSDQKVFRDVAYEATSLQRRLSKEADDKLLGEIKAKGVQVDTVDRAQFVAATKSVYDKWTNSLIGEFVKRVVEASN